MGLLSRVDRPCAIIVPHLAGNPGCPPSSVWMLRDCDGGGIKITPRTRPVRQLARYVAWAGPPGDVSPRGRPIRQARDPVPANPAVSHPRGRLLRIPPRCAAALVNTGKRCGVAWQEGWGWPKGRREGAWRWRASEPKARGPFEIPTALATPRDPRDCLFSKAPVSTPRT